VAGADSTSIYLHAWTYLLLLGLKLNLMDNYNWGRTLKILLLILFAPLALAIGFLLVVAYLIVISLAGAAILVIGVAGYFLATEENEYETYQKEEWDMESDRLDETRGIGIPD
jgi:hypothetical protein